MKCEIDGVPYPVASEKNNLLFSIVDTGEALVETWNDWHLGLGATDHIPGMYFFSTGGDASRFGQIRAPLGYTASATGRTSAQHAHYFQARSATPTTYTYRINNRGTGVGSTDFQKFNADMSTLINSLAVGSDLTGPGRPVYWGSKWYVSVGGGGVYRLQTVSNIGTVVGDLDFMTWTAICMSTFTSGGTAKIARAYNINQVALATAAPLSSADPGDWASGVSVGDTSTSITDMVENQGLLFVAKEDNLYEFDADSVARPVLPFGDRVGVDPDNGKGMLAFGDTILYPSVGGLWRYKIGQSARPVGIETIGTYADTSSGGTFIRFRLRGLTNIGEWIWMVYEDGSANTYPIAARLRRPDDPPGHEFVWHVPAVGTGLRSKALFATSSQRLVFQTASDSASASDQMLPLGPDGSPASFTGARTTGGSFIMGETNFGRPQKRKQVRSVYADFDTGGAVTFLAARDDNAAASIGSLSASGVVNYTPGTNDKCIRWRPSLSFGAATGIIRSLTVEARTPSIYRVVIPADDAILGEYGLTSEDVFDSLMRLVNKGLVSVMGPAGVRDTEAGTAWQGYVEKMTETVYETDRGIGRGIEVLISRYTTDGN